MCIRVLFVTELGLSHILFGKLAGDEFLSFKHLKHFKTHFEFYKKKIMCLKWYTYFPWCYTPKATFTLYQMETPIILYFCTFAAICDDPDILKLPLNSPRRTNRVQFSFGI